jgi:DNA-binding response OmpR family regulator
MAHILLVDDLHFMREFLQFELTQMGHEVSCVNDLDALYIYLEDHIPDLVLLDPNLNGFKGWDLLREIKRTGRHPIPTILYTSFEATLLDDRTFLADGYVIKNVNTQSLKEKMAEMLSTGGPSVSNREKWPDSDPLHALNASGPSMFGKQGDKTHGRP